MPQREWAIPMGEQVNVEAERRKHGADAVGNVYIPTDLEFDPDPGDACDCFLCLGRAEIHSPASEPTRTAVESSEYVCGLS